MLSAESVMFVLLYGFCVFLMLSHFLCYTLTLQLYDPIDPSE